MSKTPVTQVQLTSFQIINMYEFLGGDKDPDVQLTLHLTTPNNGEDYGEGYFLSLTEQPEEGSVFMPAAPPNIPEPDPAPKLAWVEEVSGHRISGEISPYIYATDARSFGNANHRYEITGLDSDKNTSNKDSEGYLFPSVKQVILFQKGPIQNGLMNGITIETLLAVCEHRLRGFQSSSFACKENAEALERITGALEWLKKRTLDRIARQVEGKMEK